MRQASPIPAATLVLVRDRSGAAPEVLMVERASTMAFAAGMMVFPGGRVDPEDVALGERLGSPLGAAIVAAVRETLEETAVPVGLDPLPSPTMALELQAELLAGTSLEQLLAAHHLRFDPSALTPLTRWLPPENIHRRFDTWFFVAAAPPGAWQPNVGEAENRAAEWLSAGDAIERDRIGPPSLMFPTRANLKRLALHDSFAAVIDDIAAHPPTTVAPHLVEREGEKWLTLPEGIGYPPIAERLPSVRRD